MWDHVNFSNLRFDPKEHRYYLNGTRLDNVTRFLKTFQKPFDRNRVANRVADRENRPVADVLAEWDAKGAAAMELGTRVHKYIENILKESPANGDDPFLSLNAHCPEIGAFHVLWSMLSKDKKIDVVQVEWIIGDAEFGLAGTADALLYSPETGLYHLWDWKTGKFDTANQWDKLLAPFESFDACKLNIYSLQLSLYRLIIERNTSLVLGDSYLAHFSPGGDYTIHQAVDFRPQLLAYFDNR